MEIGSGVKTLIDKAVRENLEEIVIPKGTIGIVCEIHGTWAYVEIWGADAPHGVEGAYAFRFDEIEELHESKNRGE